MGTALKLVIVFAGILAAAALTALLKFGLFLAKNGRPRTPKEERYGGEQGKNALILYQPSPHGTVDIAAKRAALALNEKGYTVVMNYPSDLLDYDLDQYEVVCLGSAVYIGKVSAALTNYIKKHPFTGKRVFLFLIGKETEEKGELERTEALIGTGNAVSRVKVMRGQESLADDIIRRQF